MYIYGTKIGGVTQTNTQTLGIKPENFQKKKKRNGIYKTLPRSSIDHHRSLLKTEVKRRSLSDHDGVTATEEEREVEREQQWRFADLKRRGFWRVKLAEKIGDREREREGERRCGDRRVEWERD